MAHKNDPYAELDETIRYRAIMTQAVMVAAVDAGRVAGSGGGMVQLDAVEAAVVPTTPKHRR